MASPEIVPDPQDGHSDDQIPKMENPSLNDNTAPSEEPSSARGVDVAGPSDSRPSKSASKNPKSKRKKPARKPLTNRSYAPAPPPPSSPPPTHPLPPFVPPDQPDQEVLYSLMYRNRYKSRVLLLPINPFDDTELYVPEAEKPPSIIEVQIAVTGQGALPTYSSFGLGLGGAPVSPRGFAGAASAPEAQMHMGTLSGGPIGMAADVDGDVPSLSDISGSMPSGSEDSENNGNYSSDLMSLRSSRSYGSPGRYPRPRVRVRDDGRGEFKPTIVVVTGIRIQSDRILKVLRRFIVKYPGQTLRGEAVEVRSPFPLLAHWWDELVALRDGKPFPVAEEATLGLLSRANTFESVNDAATSLKAKIAPKSSQAAVTAPEPEPLEEETKAHLQVMLKYYERHYNKDIAPEKIKFETAGVVSHSLLWYLFKPGTRVYARMGGTLTGFIYESHREVRKQREATHRRVGNADIDGELQSWEAVCWNLTFNGRQIVKTRQSFEFKEYGGEKDILSLQVFPAIYLDRMDGGRTRRRLIEVGRKFYGIARQSPVHLQYSGPAWSLHGRSVRAGSWERQKPDTEYNGEIITDQRDVNTSFRGRYVAPLRDESPPRRKAYYSGESSEDGGNESDASDDPDDDLDVEGVAKKPLPELDYRKVKGKFRPFSPKRFEALTEEYYFLFPVSMKGFGLTQKRNLGFEVEHIHPIDWPPNNEDPMSKLILGDADKDVIKSLAKKYTKEDNRWGADFIKGKGEGQIFLLHGPPGTGKTYTVECVATMTKRPLLRLTVADIGTDEGSMEDNLEVWFQRGIEWGAIILLDEADVFLEKRQIRDLRRNSLVSVFLSSLEYYTGMLFLTTNRIGQIDDAFLSRTSIAITYETFDLGKQRRLWEGFLKKLAEERKDIILTDRAKRFIEELLKVNVKEKEVPWNGREIRNALQTAISLASYEASLEAAQYSAGQSVGYKPKIIVRDEHFQAVVDRRRDFIEYRRSIRNMDEEARAFQDGSRPPPQSVLQRGGR